MMCRLRSLTACAEMGFVSFRQFFTKSLRRKVGSNGPYQTVMKMKIDPR